MNCQRRSPAREKTSNFGSFCEPLKFKASFCDIMCRRYERSKLISHRSFEEAKKLPEWQNMDEDMAKGMIKIMGAIAATNAAKAK